MKRGKDESSAASTSNANLQNVSLRSKTSPVDWKQCIFCQQEQKEVLHLIQEMKVSRRILESAKYNQSLRPACVNDLTSTDAKHHRNCLILFDRRALSIEMTLLWLCQELEAAKQADILDLVDV